MTNPHLDFVPFGERGEMPPVVGWNTFPFEGAVNVKPFQEPVLPEQPRSGAGGVDCGSCEREDASFLWTDENWRVGTTRQPSGLPAVLFLYPRAHHDLVDMPPELAASYGPVIQRVERAYLALGGIARVQQARWGDGSEHLHLWFFGRPEGMLQLRGTYLSTWDDILPAIPEERWRENLRRIAAALAEEGGTAHV